jgi:hypothetical protein
LNRLLAALASYVQRESLDDDLTIAVLGYRR